MEELLYSLIQLAIEHKASDIHFIVKEDHMDIQFRNDLGMEKIEQDIWDKGVFEYMKFIAGFDLTNPLCPQSGQFSVQLDAKEIFCRFSVIVNQSIQTGVLRLLRTNPSMAIDQLTQDSKSISFLKNLTNCRQGLVIFSGPTNSGKTTTLHAILHEIACKDQYNVISLEDPIEIEDELYLQLQINEAMGFTYEKGIEELLRHDPDVILIGETRNAYTARMVIRAALTGHMVFTTLHAKNALESLHRLLDFGLSEYDLKNTLTAVISQRLYKTKDIFRKECVYEILDAQALDHAIEKHEYPKEHRKLEDEIQNAVEQGYIFDPQAQFDIKDFQR